jgi:hypothetical protein
VLDNAPILSALVTCATLFGVWAFRAVRNSEPKPDQYLDRIDAAFQGAGGKRVRAIVYEGETGGGLIGGRSHNYVVTLAGPGGVIEKRPVTLKASLFGPGAMTIGPAMSPEDQTTPIPERRNGEA